MKYIALLLVLITVLILQTADYKLWGTGYEMAYIGPSMAFVVDSKTNETVVNLLVLDIQRNGSSLFILRNVAMIRDCTTEIGSIIETCYSPEYEYIVINLENDEVTSYNLSSFETWLAGNNLDHNLSKGDFKDRTKTYEEYFAHCSLVVET